MAAIEPFDPAPRLAARLSGAVPALTLLGVYRHNNATLLLAVCDTLAAEDDIRLWALDRVHPRLEQWTRGCGPGQRSDLLNKLYEEQTVPPDHGVLLSDDDYRFTAGDVGTFVRTATAADLDVAQPAHDRMSRWSHWLTSARRLSLARLTTFVEIGPLVLIRPEWRSRLLPFPPSSGMGWGVDLVWSDLRHEGCRFGVVDSVRLRHLTPVTGTDEYDVDEGRGRMAAMYETRGGYHNALRTLAFWWPWRRRPSWSRSRRRVRSLR